MGEICPIIRNNKKNTVHESIHHHADTFKAKVEEATGVTINHCYQCGKCTAQRRYGHYAEPAPAHVAGRNAGLRGKNSEFALYLALSGL